MMDSSTMYRFVFLNNTNNKTLLNINCYECWYKVIFICLTVLFLIHCTHMVKPYCLKWTVRPVGSI